MRKHLFVSGAVLALVVGLAGCSSGPSDEDAVAQAVETFMNGMLDGDGEVVCGISLREGQVVTATDPRWDACVDSVQTLSRIINADANVDTREEVVVTKATVDGDTAHVNAVDITGDIFHGATAVFDLRKIDGKWYLDAPG